MIQRDNRAWLYVIPALLVMTLSALIPLMVVVNYAFQDVFSGDLFIWVGTHWFEQTLTSAEFYAALTRSLGFSAIVLVIEIPLGVAIALAMPQKGRRASLYIVLMAIPLLTPWLVVGFIWKVLVNAEIGWLGIGLRMIGVAIDLNHPIGAWTAVVLMDIWHWTSLVVLLCYAGLVSIPDAYYHAARIDGASRWGTFRYVQLPKIRRVLIIAALLRFMDSFTIYVEPFMVTRGGPGTATTFLSLDLVQTASIQFDLGEASAQSVIYFLIILVLSWTLFKTMMQRRA